MYFEVACSLALDGEPKFDNGSARVGRHRQIRPRFSTFIQATMCVLRFSQGTLSVELGIVLLKL